MFAPRRTTLQTGLAVLMEMLTFRRPHGSPSEALFIQRFLDPLPGAEADAFGNIWVTVRAADGTLPPILWSSHTDSVHHLEGRQCVVRNGPMVSLRDPGKASKGLSNCLGADCAAGVWIMREMILAGVAGTYAFHRDEEAGGNGSSWVLKNTPERLADIKFAIAFDRKGYSDIITHQGGRTASDAFARSLAAILGGTFKPDDTGLFTDTAIYADVIPECSNVSVGYFGAHGPREEQDVDFLQELRDVVIAADWSGLVLDRDPTVKEARTFGRWDHDDFDWDRLQGRDGLGWGSRGRYHDDLVDFVRDHPAVVADFLEACGFTQEDLESHAIGAGYQ